MIKTPLFCGNNSRKFGEWFVPSNLLKDTHKAGESCSLAAQVGRGVQVVRVKKNWQPLAFSKVMLSSLFGGQWEVSTESATYALIHVFGSLFPPEVSSPA